MKAGHHMCIAYNGGEGTIRIRRPEDNPDLRHVLLYPQTRISVFEGSIADWPLPSVQFTLRGHEIDGFQDALRKR